MGCRRCAISLTALTVLGFLSVAPLPAQEDIPAHSQTLLETLEPVRLEGGVFYSNLSGYGVYLVSAERSSAPACIVLTAPKGNTLSRKAMQAVAERFLRTYRLTGFRVSVSGDAGAAFMFRRQTESPGYVHGELAWHALSSPDRMEPAIKWLHTVFGVTPQRMEGSCLVWHKKVYAGRNKCEMEVVLDLLGGAPACLEIYLNGEYSGHSCLDIFTRYLELQLSSPPRGKAVRLGRQLGVHPVGYAERRREVAGKRRLVSLWLIQSGDEAGRYWLGEAETLREVKGKEERTLPEKEPIPWPDAVSSGNAPAPEQKKAAEENAETTGEEEKPQPETEAVPTGKEAGAPPALPAPDEARAAYAERLRAL